MMQLMNRIKNEELGEEGAATSVIATVGSGLVTAFTSMSSDLGTQIANLAPVLVPIFGAIVLIGVSIKVVRKFTGR